MSTPVPPPLTSSYDRPPVTPAPTAPDTPPETKAKVEFTPEQQAKIDEIVKSAMGRAASETRQRLTQTQAELEQIKAERDRALAAVGPDATEADRLRVQLDQERQRNVELTAAQQRERLNNAVLMAASQEGFVSPHEALKLAEVPTLDEQGNFDATAVANAVHALAAKSPHLVKGTTRPGSGSGPSVSIPAPTIEVNQVFGPKSDARLANRLAIQNPREYARLKTMARTKGLIA